MTHMTCGSSLSVSISERPGMKLASEDRTAGQRRFIGPLSWRCVQVARFVGNRLAHPLGESYRKLFHLLLRLDDPAWSAGNLVGLAYIAAAQDQPGRLPRDRDQWDADGGLGAGHDHGGQSHPALPRFLDRRPRARMAPHEPFPDYREQRTAQTSPARVESQRPWSSRPVTDSRKAEPCVAVLGSVPYRGRGPAR